MTWYDNNGISANLSRIVSLGRLKRSILLGVKSLWLHRLRSLLTVLGIVFGVCSVIAMLAIGEGASYEAQEQIRQLGSNNSILRSVKPPEEKSSTSTQSFMLKYGLTYDDLKRIKEMNITASMQPMNCRTQGTLSL